MGLSNDVVVESKGKWFDEETWKLFCALQKKFSEDPPKRPKSLGNLGLSE